MPTGHASRVPRGTVLVLSWALLTTRGLCNYWDNGKLTSGVNYGGKGYHHILVEELQGSGTYSGGSSEYWSGSGSRPGSNWHWSSSGRGCYDLVKTRVRIDRRFIIRGKVLRTRDRRECELQCDRESRCRGFNYRFKTQGYEQYRDNCELSSQDASSTYHFTRDDDFDFYEKKFDDHDCYSGGGTGTGGGGGQGGRNECFRLAETETAMEGRVIRDRFYAQDIRDCERECERSPRYTCKSFTYRYAKDSWRRENCLLSDQEYRDMSTYDLVRDREADFYERRLYDRECSIDDDDDDHENQYPSGEGHSVVTGVHCYRGSCKRDRQGGYFFCETDHSGAWDYCCRPRERCGRSEGYPTSWCYVGIVGRDQWRPCDVQGRGRDFLKGPPPGIVLDNGTIINDITTIDPTI